MAISRRHGDLAREVGQGEIAHRLVAQLVAAARRGPRGEPEEAPAALAAPGTDQLVGVGHHLGRARGHRLCRLRGDLGVVEEGDEVDRPAHEQAAVIAIDTEEVRQRNAAVGEGVVGDDVEALAGEQVVEQLVRRGLDGALGTAPDGLAQAGVQHRAQPVVVAALRADEPRSAATHRLDRARSRPVGEAVHAVVGKARIGQAREDVVVGEDEPLARRGVELDGLVLAMACVPHPREI